ncbi:MAG: hypothetical protein IJJ73_09590 [Bacteroidaceae bacterium]|nr:hypothetical protein [Bacteroidaceae bacterium]
MDLSNATFNNWGGGQQVIAENYYQNGLQSTNEAHFETTVPACLRTESANELWEIAKQEGWVDEDLQPKGLSRPDAALLAARMGKVLGIEGWVPFEQLWHRQNMRQDYNKSQYNQKTDDFEKALKRKLI